MELTKNLCSNNAFFEVACVGQDSVATVMVDRKAVHTGSLTHVNNFLLEEMVLLYKGAICDFNIVDENGKEVLPFRIRCKQLMLCPFFFGKGYSLYMGGLIYMRLTPECFLEFNGPPYTLLN